MSWVLFLDDERMPAGNPEEFMGMPRRIARSFDEAVQLVEEHGFPSLVQFDHDLGDGPSGYDFAKWLVDRDMDRGGMPDGFTYDIHSQNPIGARNIQSYLNSYLKMKQIQV